MEKAYGFSLARPGQVIKEKVSLIKKIIPRVGPKKTEPQIIIGGQTCIAIKLAKCCKPKFQDDLLAFITKGEGASVHQANCSNLKKLQEKEPQRIIEAKWTNQ